MYSSAYEIDVNVITNKVTNYYYISNWYYKIPLDRMCIYVY